MKKLSVLSLITLLSFSANIFAQNFEKVSNFGDNPGGLNMYQYVPSQAKKNAPMVVVMHGCQQSAKTFATETGWQMLADKHGFYLLLPEQTSGNNGMNCFTWFEKGDVTRGNGEIASIASMMDYMENNHSIDKKNVFVTGLSAGGTMASALMASYPDRITAGAIHSGVSYGCAFQLFQSFSCMFAPGNLPAETRGDFVREASGDYTGSFPKVTVIHGSNDPFVKPANADHSTAQWANVHGIEDRPSSSRPADSQNQSIDEYRRNGEVYVQKLVIQGAKHGWSIDSANGCGRPSQFVINTGNCVAKILAESWGIAK